MSTEDPYARGRAVFMGVELLVAPGALVPREETELLGNSALEVLAGMQLAQPSIIDMCCGSGNLGCALAVRLPGARVWASDLTDGCVGVTRRNVEHLGLGERMSVHQGDLFASLAGLGLEGRTDVVVCNPPYISAKRLEGDRAYLLEHEPREAFDGGPYGLSIHQRVLKQALLFLRPGGYLLFEIGAGQDRQITLLFERAGAYDEIRLVRDSQGEARVALGRKRPSPGIDTK
jgi:release factor glutamine methyltransferase